MSWSFSDGTTVSLDGDVEGVTVFAQQLRAALADPRTQVQIWPLPHSGVVLDLERPELVHAYLDQAVRRPCDDWMMVSMTSQPDDLPELPEPPEESDAVPSDAVY